MKSIVYLFPNYFFIGAQRAAAASIRVLVQKGWDVTVLVFDQSGDMEKEIPDSVDRVELPRIPVISTIPFFRILAWPIALRLFLKKSKVKFCLSICPQTNFTMVLYRMLYGKDVIFVGEEHQHLSNAIRNDPSDFKAPWRYLYYFSLQNYYRLDLLRCVSKSAANDFVENWGVPRSKVQTVYPAFDLDRIKSRSHNIERNNAIPVICSVGRLTSQKDFILLIKAFAYARKVMPLKLKIAGTGPEKEKLQSLINELGLQQDVTLLGFVEYAEELIASSDVFVMTSIWEGFPATLVESMVLGTPVISVNCESGPAELIEDGVTGLLIQQRQPEAIGQAMINILADKTAWESMSQQAQVRVQSFSLESTVTALEDALLTIN